jgi:hypothetical protein
MWHICISPITRWLVVSPACLAELLYDPVDFHADRIGLAVYRTKHVASMLRLARNRIAKLKVFSRPPSFSSAESKAPCAYAQKNRCLPTRTSSLPASIASQ